jgi:hypothetical protein
MAITFPCKCGERIEADDQFAGQQVRCPYCEAVVAVPAGPKPPPKRAKLLDPPDTDDDRGASASSLNPTDRRNRPSSRRRRDDEDDEEDDDRPRRRRRQDDDEEEDDRPRRRSAYAGDDDDYRPRRRGMRRRREEPEYKLLNGQVVGGCLSVVVSLAIVIGLLFVDVFWWGLLFVTFFGFVSIVRGLATGRDN